MSTLTLKRHCQVEEEVNFHFVSHWLAHFGLKIPSSVNTQAGKSLATRAELAGGPG